MKTLKKLLFISVLVIFVISSTEKIIAQSIVTTENKKAVKNSKEFVELKAYPNPSAGMLNVALDNLDEGEITISLYSLDGTELIKTTSKVNSSTHHEVLDACQLPDGIYKVIIQSDNIKFIKLWSKGI